MTGGRGEKKQKKYWQPLNPQDGRAVSVRIILQNKIQKKLQWLSSSAGLQVSRFPRVHSSLQSACNVMWLKHDSGEWNLRAGGTEGNSFTTQTSQLIIRKLPCHISFCLPMSSSPLLPVVLAARTLSVRLSPPPPGFYSLRSPAVAEIVGLTDRDIVQNGCHCTGLWATSKVDDNPFAWKTLAGFVQRSNSWSRSKRHIRR